MELREIPAAFQSKLRLAVVAALISGPKDFTTLTKITEATPGNLGRQMEILESDGFITCQKELNGKRPRSIYRLSDHGRQLFISYVQLLEQIVGGDAK